MGIRGKKMVVIQKPGKEKSYVTFSPDCSTETIADIDRALIIDTYKEHGAILFRGFPFNVGVFQGLTTSFCSHSMFNKSAGREVIDHANKIQTVDPGDNPFPLHPEMGREPWKPDIAFFACENPPQQEGQTFFCDGVELVRKMPSRTLKAVNKRSLRYSLPIQDAGLKYWLKKDDYTEADMDNPPEDCPFEFIRHNGQIFRSYVQPFLHRPMFSNKLAFGNFLLFARYIHNDKWFPTYENDTIVPDDLVETIKKTGDKLSEYIQWQAGDVMMIDNSRFMHGRTRITNIAERRILTYFGYLKFACPKQDPVPNARWRQTDWLVNV